MKASWHRIGASSLEGGAASHEGGAAQWASSIMSARTPLAVFSPPAPVCERESGRERARARARERQRDSEMVWSSWFG